MYTFSVLANDNDAFMEFTNVNGCSTNKRLHMMKKRLVSYNPQDESPFMNELVLTEPFDKETVVDGVQTFIINKPITSNIVDGSWSARELYGFLRLQLDSLLTTNDNVYFINIVSGSEYHQRQQQFNNLLNDDEYQSIIDKVFVGTQKELCEWFLRHIK